MPEQPRAADFHFVITWYGVQNIQVVWETWNLDRYIFELARQRNRRFMDNMIFLGAKP